jgi:hypothetical protein
MKEPSKKLQSRAVSLGETLENCRGHWVALPLEPNGPAPLWLEREAFALGDELARLAESMAQPFAPHDWRGLPLPDVARAHSLLGPWVASVGVLPSGLVVSFWLEAQETASEREILDLMPFQRWLLWERPARRLALIARALRDIEDSSPYPRLRTEAARLLASVRSYSARLARDNKATSKRRALRLVA